MGRPERTCVGCRRVAGQDQLLRMVSTASGGIEVGRNLPGRGAWICAGSRSCLDVALRKGALARALRSGISPVEGDQLRSMLFTDQTEPEG
ncbi:MAG: YlxR family protein [Acidimicrobiales bacterium]